MDSTSLTGSIALALLDASLLVAHHVANLSRAQATGP